ncbi:MAG: hypothetical protein KatS3mg105_1131 [Gemmatales bacterium]|nr:MAG: hypothetical protein KatS3mg105_1131 [Gemmatales bacterium]
MPKKENDEPLQEQQELRCSRRKFLASTAALTLGTSLSAVASEPESDSVFTRPPIPDTDERQPLAVVCTVYRPMSHAYHIAGRFLYGYAQRGKQHVPRQFIRSIYVDQVPDNDLSREIGKKFNIKITRNVRDALTEEGKLAVAGVLLIGEHGNYPRNDKGQILYPRYELMEQIVAVFRQTGKSVPVFNDKHLSYSWTKAKKMYEWSREPGFPFMAGSSLPVTWRKPELELPLQAKVEDVLVAAYGPVEVYGFHALEALQVMAERRHGGETGVKAVTCLTGAAVWQAADEGKWSWQLLEAALSRSETLNPGDIRRNVKTPLAGQSKTPVVAFLIEYLDGLRGTVLLLNGHIQDFCFAAKIQGEAKPVSCLFYLPSPPGARYFDCLVANIEKLFQQQKAPYPVERTLLTSGMLDFLMESRHKRGARIETPELQVHYSPPADSGFCRGSTQVGC